MSSKTDCLQSNHEKLYTQANATVDYLTLDVLNRIGITGASYDWYNTEFIPKHSMFNESFVDWRNPAERTPAKTAALLSSEKAFKPSYRMLYSGYLRGNPLVTDEDLVSMGLPKRLSGVKTHILLVTLRNIK